jgi:hypothetical protein
MIMKSSPASLADNRAAGRRDRADMRVRHVRSLAGAPRQPARDVP